MPSNSERISCHFMTTVCRMTEKSSLEAMFMLKGLANRLHLVRETLDEEFGVIIRSRLWNAEKQILSASELIREAGELEAKRREGKSKVSDSAFSGFVMIDTGAGAVDLDDNSW